MPPIPFTHLPRSPHIDASQPYNRYFGDDAISVLYKIEHRQRLVARLERDSWEDHCTLVLEQHSLLGYSKTLANLDARDMLALARALVDAAHDLLTIPGRREAEAQQISIAEPA